MFLDGTLLYCVRDPASVVARLTDGRTVNVVSANQTGHPLPLSIPYGVAMDVSRGGFWVSDKGSRAVWFVETECSGRDIKVGKTECHMVEPARGPCMLDVDEKRGLLVGCFGESGEPGAVAQYSSKGKWKSLSASSFTGCVTHCCWIDGGGYCFVNREDSVLWHASSLSADAKPLTLSGRFRRLSEESGQLSSLRLRYVQGIFYSRGRKRLIVADASLGTIYGIDLKRQRYEVVAGLPTISDSRMRAGLTSGPGKRFLGPIRGVAENKSGELVFLEGEGGCVFRVAGDRIEKVCAVKEGRGKSRLLGTGLIAV